MKASFFLYNILQKKIQKIFLNFFKKSVDKWKKMWYYNKAVGQDGTQTKKFFKKIKNFS